MKNEVKVEKTLKRDLRFYVVQNGGIGILHSFIGLVSLGHFHLKRSPLGVLAPFSLGLGEFLIS